MKKTTVLSAAVLFATAGMASAQISPIGPFSGTAHESFETIGLWPPDGPCIFCVTDPGAFGGICTIESVDGSASIHVTGGWGYICSIGPHATPRLSAATGGGGYDYHFSPGNEAGQFGGYFGTNCGVADGTVQFYDVANNLIGTQPLTVPADCSWNWQGWTSTTPISRVRVIGNGPGGGYVDMDDMEYMPGYTGPTGACCIPSTLSCALTNATACNTFGGTYHGDNSTCAAANCPTPGACCLTDGSCTQATSAHCTTLGGVYRGNSTACATANCPQPPTGACCAADGTCSVLTQPLCTAAHGTYRGDNATCAAANCPITGYIENGDAGNLPATAAVVSGSGSLTSIQGTLADTTDVDMYQINICSPANFGATTVGGTTIDTMMFLFHADGTGISGNDDSQSTTQSTLTNAFVSALPAGNYYLAVTMWDNEPESNDALNLWSSLIPESAPNGPGAASPVAEWSTGGASNPGAYTIFLTGSCFVSSGPTCYANCDHSTTVPCLNVLDFGCFLNKFAAGEDYANCDHSTTPPVLNVLDFGCFLNKFAAGCSGC